MSFAIVVHSHLSWDWVWQRPQQFMSRLARRHPVLFVETHGPSPDLPEPRASLYTVRTPGVTVLRVQFPTRLWGDAAFVDRERRRLVQEAIEQFVPVFRHAVHWFYDPMAVTAFGYGADPLAIVYDCMDELAKFRGAPPEIVRRERQLLHLADVVFTGGRKLYESKSLHNPNTHFYGCGVDVPHFGQADAEATPVAAELEALTGPILGYIGVVDERLDYDLLAWLADQRSDWNFVMVGPSVKVDPKELPRRDNLHWLGGRDYQYLPSYLKAFDMCLMPFALNEATEYINPTKTLEYLASGRPVVSTPVDDVVRNFGDYVYLGDTREAFLQACARVIEHPDPVRIHRGREMTRAHTWDSIVAQLEAHVQRALEPADAPLLASTPAASLVQPLS